MCLSQQRKDGLRLSQEMLEVSNTMAALNTLMTKLSIGEITFYSSDSSRVADAIEYYNDEQQREEDAEEQQRRDEKNGLYPDRWDDAN